MPIWLHILLVVVITGYFIFRFIKNHNFYEILFVVWAPSTLLQYLSDDPTFLRVVGILQILVFIIVVFLMFKRRNVARQNTAKIIASYASGDLDKIMGARNDSSEQKTEETESEEKEIKPEIK